MQINVSKYKELLAQVSELRRTELPNSKGSFSRKQKKVLLFAESYIRPLTPQNGYLYYKEGMEITK